MAEAKSEPSIPFAGALPLHEAIARSVAWMTYGHNDAHTCWAEFASQPLKFDTRVTDVEGLTLEMLVSTFGQA